MEGKRSRIGTLVKHGQFWGLMLVGLGGGCSRGAQAPIAPRAAESAVAEQTADSARREVRLPSEAAAVAPADQPSPGRQAQADGNAAFSAGDLPAARSSFERAAALDPEAPEPHVALGAVFEHQGKPDQALAAYDAALAAAAGHGGAILAKARLLVAGGAATEANAFARAQLAQHSQSPAALTALSEVSSAQGDSGRAQRFAQQALKLNPDYRPAMVALARDHFRAHRIELSLFTLTAILDGYGAENPARDKDNVDALQLRALILSQRGRAQAATRDLERVVQLRPDLVQPRLSLAAQLLRAGNAEAARPLMEAALQFEPANVWVHLTLGDTYRLLGMPEDALKHLKWVARRDPKLPQVHYNMGLVYLFSGQLAELSEIEAVEQAIVAFERYKLLANTGARARAADIDELLNRAKNKKSILELMSDEGEDLGG